MAKSDLLKEAIADAKAVKETALANAKIALQEAFAPRIQNMLSAKLSEELGDEEELEAEPEAEMDDMGDVEGGMDDMEDAGDEMGTDVGDIELDTDADGEMDFYGDIMSKEAPGGEMEAEAEPEAEMSDEEADAEFEEEGDLGLDEIIAELEGDMKLDLKDEPVLDSPVDEGSMYEEEDEVYSESIDDIINEILDEEMDVEEEDNIEEAQIGAESIDSNGAELNEALQSLEESYKTIHHLKSVINEVNLLNAKLLYTNKLFRNFELSESQKMKVIENFDRATTTRETKLVFTTLAESFTRPAKKRVVKESYASRPSTSTAPSKKFKENTQILSEGFEHANRWKKLAGLI